MKISIHTSEGNPGQIAIPGHELPAKTASIESDRSKLEETVISEPNLSRHKQQTTMIEQQRYPKPTVWEGESRIQRPDNHAYTHTHAHTAIILLQTSTAT